MDRGAWGGRRERGLWVCCWQNGVCVFIANSVGGCPCVLEERLFSRLLSWPGAIFLLELACVLRKGEIKYFGIDELLLFL